MTKKETKKRLTREERRSQIVEVAYKLFSKKGFNGTTTKEIAMNAHVSEATIFKHFSKKEDLYKEIITAYTKDNKRSKDFFSSIEGREGKDFFYAVAFNILENNKKDSTFQRLMLFSALEREKFSELVISSIGEDFMKLVAGEIDKLIKKKEFIKTDSYLAARTFMGMVNSFVIGQEIYGLKKKHKYSSDEVATNFVNIFINGIKR